jgi:hypothetical protein
MTIPPVVVCRQATLGNRIFTRAHGNRSASESAVGGPCQIIHRREEAAALTGEETGAHQAIERGGGSWSFRGGRPDNGTLRQLRGDELAWFRHDQVFLPEFITFKGLHVGEAHTGHADLGRVSSLIMPDGEMVYFRTSDPQKDLEDGEIGNLQGERRVKVGATLLNRPEMKRSGVGNRLGLIGTRRQILQRDGRAINNVYELWEISAEIQVVGAAVANPPARIHG